MCALSICASETNHYPSRTPPIPMTEKSNRDGGIIFSEKNHAHHAAHKSPSQYTVHPITEVVVARWIRGNMTLIPIRMFRTSRTYILQLAEIWEEERKVSSMWPNNLRNQHRDTKLLWTVNPQPYKPVPKEWTPVIKKRKKKKVNQNKYIQKVEHKIRVVVRRAPNKRLGYRRKNIECRKSEIGKPNAKD
jgi:hypothetical protein